MVSDSTPLTATGRIANRRLVPVDPRVRDALRQLAVRHARQGVRVFLFGSVARSWPRAPVGADFDIGFEIKSPRGDRDAARRTLEGDLDSLPSIRPVDLVDFSLATETFRTEATKHVVELADESPAEAAE